MLADVVACNRGVWFTNEPFAVLPGHPGYDVKRATLPCREHSQFFSLSPEELTGFSLYVDMLLRIEDKTLGTCRRTLLPMRANRVSLKILNANWMLDWFIENTDCHAIFLTRHPASQALSVIRQRWQFGAEAYFREPQELCPYLSASQIELGLKILKRGDVWEIAILDWVILNHPLAITKQRHEINVVRYEDLIRDPAPFTRGVLNEELHLQDLKEMLATFNVPSNSSTMSRRDTKSAILEGRTDYLLNRWQDEVDEHQKRAAQRILETFEVSAYNMSSPLPSRGDSG